MYISNLYQSITKYKIDSITNFKSKSFYNYDKTIIATLFMNPASRYGIVIYQRDPITLIHNEIQYIPPLYAALFRSVAIDK